MLLAQLIDTSARVSATRSRRSKIEALAQLLRQLQGPEIPIGLSYLSGDARHPRLGAGYAALKEASCATPADGASLTLSEVDEALRRLAALHGAGSARERARLLRALFERASASEQEFLFRLLLGELRQGALEGVMLEALASASQVPAAALRMAAMRAGGAAEVAPAALSEGVHGLQRFALRIFQPVQPMLAQPAESVAAALERLGTAAFEWKLDGVRVQAHRSGEEVRVYTRTLNEVTWAVPEIAQAALRLQARELILDGEAIALKPDGTPQPFQETMRRFGRRLDVDTLKAMLPLSVFWFDCLLKDGEDLTAVPARQRFDALEAISPAQLIVPRLITAEARSAQAFFDASLTRGHEGVMAKALEAPYEAGGRGGAWLKIKQANTLDLVILAAEWGNGRRSGWLSNLHLGARDAVNGGFVMLGKTFKGMTDEMLAWQTERLLALEIRRERHIVQVKAELVVEVAFNEIQQSPRYPAGLALRFARVKRYRQDKRALDADTLETVRALYEAQTHRKSS